MSSGFVSGGTTEQPAERNELWIRAEQELAESRQRQQEQKAHDGKSLYEVLQANKAAKQEAFEESMKIKHQFRSLDDDDVDFLNSIQDADDANARAVRKDELERLTSFRQLQQQQQQQQQSEVSVSSSTGRTGFDAGTVSQANSLSHTDQSDLWRLTAKPKRKRGKDHEGGGGASLPLKLSKTAAAPPARPSSLSSAPAAANSIAAGVTKGQGSNTTELLSVMPRSEKNTIHSDSEKRQRDNKRNAQKQQYDSAAVPSTDLAAAALAEDSTGKGKASKTSSIKPPTKKLLSSSSLLTSSSSPTITKTTPPAPPPAPGGDGTSVTKAPSLGLVDYGSDDDDND